MDVLASAAALLLLVLGRVSSRVPSVDDEALAAALEVRIGAKASAWTVDVDPGTTTSEVTVRLRRDDGRELRRQVTLAGTTGDAHVRELAAALSLAIEQVAAEDATSPPATPGTRPGADRPRAPLRGWLAAGGRFAAGNPANVDGGATLRGGMWWGREHLQPTIAVSSSHARPGDLRVDGWSAGAGLAVGASHRVWWLGGSAIAGYAWTRATAGATARTSTFALELTGLAQLRLRRLLLGFRLGADVRAPPVRVVGADEPYRLGSVRFVAGFEIGAIFGPHNRRDRLEPRASGRSNATPRVGYNAMAREPSP